MNPNLVNLVYLIAGVLFILGIKGLTKPKTAVRGNLLSAVGMMLAVIVTLMDSSVVNMTYIVAGVTVGTLIGAVMALRIQMTSMPEMVALLNGFGGGASLSIALAEYYSRLGLNATSVTDLATPMAVGSAAFGEGFQGTVTLISIALTVLIGALTLTGSVIAFTKLKEIMKNSYGLPGGPIGNGLLLAAALFAVGTVVMDPVMPVSMVTIP